MISAEGHLNSWLITQNITYRILTFRLEFKSLFIWLKMYSNYKELESTPGTLLLLILPSSSSVIWSCHIYQRLFLYFFFFLNWNQQSKVEELLYICYWDTWPLPLDFSQIWSTSSLSSLFLAFFFMYLSFLLPSSLLPHMGTPLPNPLFPLITLQDRFVIMVFSYFQYIETFHNGGVDPIEWVSA